MSDHATPATVEATGWTVKKFLRGLEDRRFLIAIGLSLPPLALCFMSKNLFAHCQYPWLGVSAIAASAWIGGLRAGALTTVLVLLGFSALLTDSEISLSQSWPANQLTWIGLLMDATFVAGLIHISQISKEKLKGQLEDSFTRLSRLEEANRIKQNFIANMSHEIRDPLSAILGYLEILRDESPNEIERRSFVDRARANAATLNQLVNDLVDASDLDSTEFINHFANRKPIPLLSFLQETYATYAPLAREKGLKFRVRFRGIVPKVARTDPDQLAQILRQVIGNCIRYSDHGQIEVTVSASKTAAGRREVALIVSDEGPGIAKEIRSQIFQIFPPVGELATKTHSGTGFGLTMARRLARGLGGDVKIAKSDRRGTTVLITFDAGPTDERDESLLELNLPLLPRAHRAPRASRAPRATRASDSEFDGTIDAIQMKDRDGSDLAFKDLEGKTSRGMTSTGKTSRGMTLERKTLGASDDAGKALEGNEIDGTNFAARPMKASDSREPGLDATDLDATDLDATDLDATDLDATNLDATNADTNDLVASQLETTDVDTADLDASALDVSDIGVKEQKAGEFGANQMGVRERKMKQLGVKDLETKDLEIKNLEIKDLETKDLSVKDQREHTEGEILTGKKTVEAPIFLAPLPSDSPFTTSQKEAETKHNQFVDLSGIQVLVIDDSPDNTQLVSRILKLKGAKVEIANQAFEGIEKALLLQPDVTFMDIQMPEIDGHEATRRLRQAGFQKPIVALSAHVMKDDRERAERAGANGFLAKPLNRKDLVEMILKLTLNRSRLGSAQHREAAILMKQPEGHSEPANP